EADPQAQAYVLTEEKYFRQPVSETFQGRDVFAPVAAHIAQGLSPSALGPPLKDPVLLDWPRPRLEGEQLIGQVLGVDSFGNLSTNLIREVVTEFLQGRQATVKVAGLDIPALSRAYGQAEPGQAVAVFNSMDRLELALNQGDLCAKLGLSPSQVFGLEVVLTRQG
ncbi:MAG: SAM-dependent chlorinase/fluorinase, partial [Desulfarculaceae bacterium]